MHTRAMSASVVEGWRGEVTRFSKKKPISELGSRDWAAAAGPASPSHARSSAGTHLCLRAAMMAPQWYSRTPSTPEGRRPSRRSRPSFIIPFHQVLDRSPPLHQWPRRPSPCPSRRHCVLDRSPLFPRPVLLSPSRPQS
jgi:hypothetical protein